MFQRLRSRIPPSETKSEPEMIEIRKTAIAFEEEELLELERIMIDRDEKEALDFLKKSVYDKVAGSQQVRTEHSQLNKTLRT
jgi:hypothetical protein